MIREYLLRVAFVVLLLLSTLVHALIVLKWKNSTHRYVLLILSVFLLNESACFVMYIYGIAQKTHYTLALFIHTLLWLLILRQSVRSTKLINNLIITYVAFTLCNFFLIEGWYVFNCYSFIMGSFIYLIVLLLESFQQLKQENFRFFSNNRFLLLMSPVLFFIGITFMLGFRNHDLLVTKLFNELYLYKIINIVVNVAYYSLLHLYIFREKNKTHEL